MKKLFMEDQAKCRNRYFASAMPPVLLVIDITPFTGHSGSTILDS